MGQYMRSKMDKKMEPLELTGWILQILGNMVREMRYPDIYGE
jgi:hypothetical protein